jgi:hypothetical protein
MATRNEHVSPLRNVHLDYDGSDRARLLVERSVQALLAGPVAERRLARSRWRADAGSDHDVAVELLGHVTGDTKQLTHQWRC